MQTFLPHESFRDSLRCLDYRRLGKQRVEAMQLINAISGIPSKGGKPYKGWINHPAAVMWRGYLDALKWYHNLAIEEWVRRGYNNTMRPMVYNCITMEFPHWLGDEEFHASHRSNLLRKDPEFYGVYGWKESDGLEYIWPGQQLEK